VDIGVRALGEALSAELDATFICQSFSRLVIDCNRDPSSAGSILESSDGRRSPATWASARTRARSDGSRSTSPITRPSRASCSVGGRPARGPFSSPSQLHARARRRAAAGQLGLLHDEGDTTLTRALLGRLRQEPQLCVGDNEPYRMDGTDYTIPRHAYPAGVRYLEVEFRPGSPARSERREAVGAPVRGMAQGRDGAPLKRVVRAARRAMVTTLWFDGSPADGSDRPGSRSLPDVIAQPQREADLGDDEERPDEEPHEVVDERGLFPSKPCPTN